MTKKTKPRRKAPERSTQQYITALEAENAKLHRQVAKLQVQERSTQNRLKALEKEFQENRPTVSLNINTATHEPTLADLMEKARHLGYRLERIVSERDA